MVKLYPHRRIGVVLHDLVASGAAWWIAYWLRFNFELPVGFVREVTSTVVWVVLLQGAVFLKFGLYRGMWRYASVADLRRIFMAVLLAAALVPLVLWMFRVNAVVPRAVLVIDPLLLMMMMGGSRFIYRMWKEQSLYRAIKLHGVPVLILGAGDAGIALSKELARGGEWRVVGFLDDDPNKTGLILNDVKVLGRIDSLSHWASQLEIHQVIVAMPSASHQERRKAIEAANAVHEKVLTVPAFADLLSGRVSISQLRPIELDDLLGRDPIELDKNGLKQLLAERVVLVTGAGGSIGAELCRQIAQFSPKILVLYEASELALYNIEQELQKKFGQLQIIYLAGDVRDETRLEQVFAEYRPDVVFHAAAYKHVPLMECHNAWQAIRNNVFGTWCVARCAQRHQVGKFVLISTDKAVNPTNVMGASKRLAEIICQGLQQPQGTRYVLVRFGNVLGSNGSVIPKFREQIAKGGPVTVTHPEITRYFMSIPEAAQLVLQAGLMGNGGEIFVLDMGEPVKIVDLAKDLIRLSGLGEDDIKIEFTGLRPGEKLYEELLADSEHTLPTPHPKLRIAEARNVDAQQFKDLTQWIGGNDILADDQVRQDLRRWVPEYRPAKAD